MAGAGRSDDRRLLEASCQTRTAEHQSADEGGEVAREQSRALDVVGRGHMHVGMSVLFAWQKAMLLASMMAETFGFAWLLAVSCGRRKRTWKRVLGRAGLILQSWICTGNEGRLCVLAPLLVKQTAAEGVS